MLLIKHLFTLRPDTFTLNVTPCLLLQYRPMYMYFTRLRSWFDLVDIGVSCTFITYWFYLVFNLIHVMQVFYVDLPQYLDLYVKIKDVDQREKKPIVVFSDDATVRDSHIDACPRMRGGVEQLVRL